MSEALGSILPNAVAIAISPLPIVAVIMMLMSPRGRGLGLSFLAGWIVGIAVALTAFTLLADVLPEPEGTSSQPVVGVIQIGLGIGLFFLAARQWRSRPKPGDTPSLPGWMARIESMRPPVALGLGFALAAVNPKNLLVAATAGMIVGRATLDVPESVLTIAVFTVIAAASVALPVLVTLVAPTWSTGALASARGWLTANNAAIMMVVLAVLGAKAIGGGIAAF